MNNTEERITVLTKYFLQKIASHPNKEFITIATELYANPQEQKVLDIAQKLKITEKQLFRTFKKNYGVSPKVLLNILRLHLCLTLLLENKKELIDIAIECGYYDQSHFIKDIKRYTHISPLKLLEEYKN